MLHEPYLGLLAMLAKQCGLRDKQAKSDLRIAASGAALNSLLRGEEPHPCKHVRLEHVAWGCDRHLDRDGVALNVGFVNNAAQRPLKYHVRQSFRDHFCLSANP